MTIHVSAFRWVPPFAQGHVRDLRVRWALEEAGLPYQAALIGPADQTSETYRAWQPFGQVPAFRDWLKAEIAKAQPVASEFHSQCAEARVLQHASGLGFDDLGFVKVAGRSVL